MPIGVGCDSLALLNNEWGEVRMKSIHKLLLLTVALLGFSAAGAVAQQLKQQLVGIWSVVSVTNEVGGKKIEPFGPNPQGYYIFTAGGHIATSTTRSGIPKFVSNNRFKGTASENEAVVHGNISTFGTYTVNEADHSVMVHIIGSSFPNWSGTDQKRIAEISGDQLKWSLQAPSGGTVTVMLKRVE
jgi:hypothetical protein